MTRDNNWLKFRLETIWKKHFSDIKVANNVYVAFGRKSRTRLGSIKFMKIGLGRSEPRQGIGLGKIEPRQATIITINGHFIDIEIPEYVIDAVLAHELTHYAHGFCSPHEQKFRNPHKGGVVNRELVDRGLRELLQLEKRWIKTNWRNYLMEHLK